MSVLKKSLLGLSAVVLLFTLGVSHFIWINETFDPDEPLSVLEKTVVYSGHATMVAGGFLVGYTEVAQEAFYLHIDGPEKREWRSSFPSSSPRVQKALEGLRADLRSGARHATATVAWPRYTAENGRHALALNSFQITSKKAGDGGVIYRGVVRCSYPEDAPVTIRTGLFAFRLNEGVYRALEKAGWLHPYDAVWRWREPL